MAGLTPPEKPKADAVVVLTGGTQRIDQAVNLLETGTGQRLLISGVHPDTSAARIREMTRAPQSLFVCCVDLGYDAIDTVGNALETAKWSMHTSIAASLWSPATTTCPAACWNCTASTLKRNMSAIRSSIQI